MIEQESASDQEAAPEDAKQGGGAVLDQFKDSRWAVFGPAGIAFLAALLATLIGQQINASIETSKIVRAKLEEAYFRTLTLPRIAIDVNLIAISPVQHTAAAQAWNQYNATVTQYNNEMAYLVAVADLYEDAITAPSHTLRDCSGRFLEQTANYFVASYRLAPENRAMTPFTPQQLNDLVALRQQCEAATANLRTAIAANMKRHLSHWPL